jgi:DnaJ-class molecular chaperone
MNNHDPCPECQGTGRQDECAECNSYGWVDDPEDGGTMTCPGCNGDSCEDCRHCEGTGELL